jgi:hypothetical protein
MLDIAVLWSDLFWPLLRLIFFISLGVLIGNLIESLNWTRAVAKLASPLVRIGHLRSVSGASFSMAFFSGVTANTMLAEAYDQGQLNNKELVLSNLFNSLPTYFLHLPTTFFIIAPMIKVAAFPYLFLTAGAAFFRAFVVLCVARVLLPEKAESGPVDPRTEKGQGEKQGKKLILNKIWKRFQKRIRKILKYTVPIYLLIFFLHRFGVFQWLEGIMASDGGFLFWLPPESLSILISQLAAEFTAGLAAAGALLDAGTLTVKEVVVALVLGNILSSPIRAFRHQFPYYAGIYKPALALKLIVFNQGLRVSSLLAMGSIYYFCF